MAASLADAGIVVGSTRSNPVRPDDYRPVTGG